jgi:4'-phosphopantetheinyl transferase
VTSVVSVHTRPVSDDPDLAELLDDEERARSRKRRDPSRYITAHALFRTVVAERTGQRPAQIAFDRRCMTCGSTAHGKPVVRGHPEVFVSLSYAGELAVVALTAAGEVGVDVEELADADHEGFEASTLAPEEAPAFAAVAAYRLAGARAQVWARKEAVLKATGHGLVVDPRDVVVSGPDQDATLVAWRGLAPMGSPVHLLDVPLGAAGYAAAVAVLCPESLEPVQLDIVSE